MPLYPRRWRVGRTGSTVGIEPASAGQRDIASFGDAKADSGRDAAHALAVLYEMSQAAPGSDEALALAVLDRMSPADQEVLRLAFGRTLDAAEVAVTLGVSVRRAQALVRSATARFEARSIAIALTTGAGVICPVLAERVPDVSAGDAELSDRHCKLVAEHAASCQACSAGLASGNAGSDLVGTLETLMQDQPPRSALTEPDRNRRGRFWETSPVLVAASAAAVLVIVLGAFGVHKLIGQPVSAAASPGVTSQPTARATNRPSPSPSPSPSPTKAPQPSPAPAAVLPPPVSPRQTTPTSPKPSSSPTPSVTPSSPSPSPTASAPTTQ
jgi:DNA-binding CsgD family transcriptional regulator